MNVPSDLQYTKSHEWVRMDHDIATVGITEYAQSELGDIVFVDLPTNGRAIEAGQSVGSVESVKTVSDLYAPVTGEVIEANSALGARPELVNSSPYDEGWMFKVRLSGSPSGLLSADEYKALLEE
jgi:glycine cleavage system H protein